MSETAVDLCDRAKVQSNWQFFTPTVHRLEKSFLLHLISVDVKTVGELCGVSSYDHQNFRSNQGYSKPIVPATARNTEETIVLLSGMDEVGNTAVLQVHGFRPFFYVECPDEWGTAELNSLMNTLSSKLAVPHLGWEQQYLKHFCHWSCAPNSTRTREWNCIKIYFPNQCSLRKAHKILTNGIQVAVKYSVRTFTLSVYEHRIALSSQFLDKLNATASCWIRVTCWQLPDLYYSHSQIEVKCQFTDLEPLLDKDDMPPFRKVSWDTEWYCKDKSFPQSLREEDRIICFNTNVKLYGGTVDFDVAHVLGNAAPKKPALIVYRYETQLEVLEAWRDFIVLDVQPQILIGYNLDGFDTRMVMERADLLSAGNSRFFEQSVYFAERTPLKEHSFQSGAKGQNIHYIMDNVSGRASIDMLHFIKDNFKLKFNSLDFVSKHFLGEEKVNMPAS